MMDPVISLYQEEDKEEVENIDGGVHVVFFLMQLFVTKHTLFIDAPNHYGDAKGVFSRDW